MINANELCAWDECLRQPMGGVPLHEPVITAIYCWRFNDEFDLTTRVIQNLC